MAVPISGVIRERELVRQGASPQEIRALTWDTGSAASAVPTSMARALYETLAAEISMLRAPTMKIVSSSGEAMDFPTVVTHGIATQVSGQGTTPRRHRPGVWEADSAAVQIRTADQSSK